MNLSEVLALLKAAELANDTVLFEGVHGIGKSDVVKLYAKENNYFCQELFLSMMDTGDLIGIPRVKTVGTSTITTWAEPDWFQRITDAAFPQLNRISDLVFTDPEFKSYMSTYSHDVITRTELNSLYSKFYDIPEDTLHLVTKYSTVYSRIGRRSVLFLDELNRSVLDVRQASLQLILNGELHSHKLPYINGKRTIIVAAINPADQYQVEELDPALIDRFLHVELVADAKSWLTWARNNNINPIVQAYIAEYPNRLHFTPKNNGIGATPRSWAKLSVFMDHINTIPKEIHFTIMKGKIGSELGAQFLSFYNNYSKVIKVEDIEVFVKEQAKKTPNVEDIGAALAKLIEKQESTQKHQLAELLYDKYIKAEKTTADKAVPFISFLYALEIENLTSFLKSKKESDYTNYSKLAAFDGELNNKKLFLRITTKIQTI